MPKVKSFAYIGKEQAYDLEVEHPDHQFYLANGLLTSNSHAVAYSMAGYETAWYKLHYPAPFMASALKIESNSGAKDKDAKIRNYKKEALRLGCSVIVPDINKSLASYIAIDKHTISTGFKAIKGVGESAINNIMEVRNQALFKSFPDFIFRVSTKYVKKNIIIALAKAGCFDSLGITRRDVIELYADIRTKTRNHAKNIQDTREPWNMMNDFVYDKYSNEEYDFKTKMLFEKEVLGEYISGKASQLHKKFFKGLGQPISYIDSMNNNAEMTIEAVVSSVSEVKTKNGKNAGKMRGVYQITDIRDDIAEMMVWPDVYEKIKTKLPVGCAFRATCKVNDYNDVKSLVLVKVIEVSK